MIKKLCLILFCCILSACQATSYSGPKKAKKALLLIEEPGRSMQVRAYLHDSGLVSSNQPVLIKNTSGKILCDGHYNMTSINSVGDLTLSCFDGRLQGTGIFKNQGKRNGRSYGIGMIETGESTIKVIYGVTDREFLQGR